MEEKFLESQTNFTNFEIDLREMQGLMKKFSQIFINASKINFSMSSSKASPSKDDGIPYFTKKCLDFFQKIQNEMTSYGYRLNENIEWINQLLEKISKTKKKHDFTYENCKKRMNYVQNEFNGILKKLSSKSKSKSKIDFDLDCEKKFGIEISKNLEMKSTFILWEVNNLQSEENTIYQNLTSTKNLISSEIEKCFIEATQCRTNIIKNLSEVLQNIHLKNTNLINSMKKTNEKYFGIEKLGDITLKISKILERNDMLKKEKEARNESKPTIKPPINAKLSNQRKNYDLIGNLEQKNVDETAKDIRLLSLSSKTRSQSSNKNSNNKKKRESSQDFLVCINKQKNEIPNFLKQSHNSFRKIEEEDSQIDRNTQLSIKLKKAKSLSFIKVNRDSVCSSTTIDELQKTCDMINILNSSKQSKILKNI